MIGKNTLLGMELFSDEIENAFIFHIPHARTEIPDQFMSDFMDANVVEEEIELLTDFATDKIFDIGELSKVIFPYSRVFCDVERLDDKDEVMYKYGRGFYYTKTDSGELLRNNVNGNKALIHKDYYQHHHKKLTDLVHKKLGESGFALIVDCHSFSDLPFKSDMEQGLQRPDFCIGTDDFHTPEWLTKMVRGFLLQQGYSVEINYPYKGTIVPLEFYQKNDQVHSIMIEVNRKLYMKGNHVIPEKVEKLNEMFSNLFLVGEVSGNAHSENHDGKGAMNQE